MKGLGFDEVKRALGEGTCILIDLRSMEEFAREHIKGSVNVEYHDEYLDERMELMVPEGLKVVFTSDDDEKSRTSAERIAEKGGYEVLGYFPGGLDEWKRRGVTTDSFRMLEPDELSELLANGACKVVDCRLDFEWELGYIEGSILIDASRFWHEAKKLDPSQAYCVVCNTGINSATGASILKSLYGINEVYNLKGGLFEWKKAGFPIYEPD